MTDADLQVLGTPTQANDQNPILPVLKRPVYWLLCVLLALPAAVPYFTHYFVDTKGLVPTGFIQYDMPYYMALARGYFTGGHFT